TAEIAIVTRVKSIKLRIKMRNRNACPAIARTITMAVVCTAKLAYAAAKIACRRGAAFMIASHAVQSKPRRWSNAARLLSHRGNAALAPTYDRGAAIEANAIICAALISASAR